MRRCLVSFAQHRRRDKMGGAEGRIVVVQCFAPRFQASKRAVCKAAASIALLGRGNGGSAPARTAPAICRWAPASIASNAAETPTTSHGCVGNAGSRLRFNTTAMTARMPGTPSERASAQATKARQRRARSRSPNPRSFSSARRFRPREDNRGRRSSGFQDRVPVNARQSRSAAAHGWISASCARRLVGPESMRRRVRRLSARAGRDCQRHPDREQFRPADASGSDACRCFHRHPSVRAATAEAFAAGPGEMARLGHIGPSTGGMDAPRYALTRSFALEAILC